MEKLQLILLCLFILSTVGFAYAFFLEKKKSHKLRENLKGFQGQSEEDMYGRGKFSELGLMSAGITHEISNPLSVILGRATQLLKPGRMDNKETTLKGIEQIKNNAERIGTIIQSVREYIYRNEDIKEDFIPLKEIIDNVLVFYGQRLKNHGIELRLNRIDKVYVSGQKGQYEQAILNLISNAFDAIDKLPEKWIEISVEKTKENIQIYFRDSGSGIPVDVQNKMLDPFYTTKKGKGSGLGLTLVRGIAQKHGGDLKYIEGEHTTFLLELPQPTGTLYHH
jgi:C4-dicarboxylate-specific signal transduction histidine kinase